MKEQFLSALGALVLALGPGLAQAQVAGSTVRATATMEVREIALGWSATRQMIGRTVVNEEGATVGRVDDLIVTPEATVSHLVVGAGGFLGVRRHDVAVPAAHFTIAGDKILLHGATPATVRALPAFEYERTDGSR